MNENHFSFIYMTTKLCKAIIFLYGLTGCDKVSQFQGCGRIKTRKAWRSKLDETKTL